MKNLLLGIMLFTSMTSFGFDSSFNDSYLCQVETIENNQWVLPDDIMAQSSIFDSSKLYYMIFNHTKEGPQIQILKNYLDKVPSDIKFVQIKNTEKTELFPDEYLWYSQDLFWKGPTFLRSEYFNLESYGQYKELYFHVYKNDGQPIRRDRCSKISEIPSVANRAFSFAYTNLSSDDIMDVISGGANGE